MRCSVLIVSYNTCQLTVEAIASVMHEPEVETIVVDNASHDGSADAIAAQYPSVRLIRSERNLGFAGGVNRAAPEASGEHMLVLNSDARLEPGALDLLLQHLNSHPRAGLVAPALRYADGRAQASAFVFPGLLQIALDLYPINRLMDSRINGRISSTVPRQVDYPLGACMLIRRAAWHDVGPLDEGYFMYLEEIDWCRRARAHGWQIWHQPRAIAMHHGGSSTSQQPDAMFAQLWRSRLRYYARFHGPTYNRVVHGLVRLGLRRRAGAAERVRQLSA
ncbi:MAG: glycosyltransferase family 2 protein [Chloroflexi bacterium]|nr:glycosyltransferase family 2 protein [Chloroflexota bacterium]MBV9897303.1 glycosyltransferase family 2 protein [Chloroflexota bacterium]